MIKSDEKSKKTAGKATTRTKMGFIIRQLSNNNVTVSGIPNPRSDSISKILCFAQNNYR